MGRFVLHVDLDQFIAAVECETREDSVLKHDSRSGGLETIRLIGDCGTALALAARWRVRAPILCGLALLCAAAGLAADLGAETILPVVSPGLRGQTYAVVESIAVALTGYLGNGLYAVGGILLTLAGRRELPPRLLWLAAAVWTVALWLSVPRSFHRTSGSSRAPRPCCRCSSCGQD